MRNRKFEEWFAKHIEEPLGESRGCGMVAPMKITPIMWKQRGQVGVQR